MARMKDPSAIAQKWARVTPGRVSEYTAGVQSPRVSWAAATQAAEGAYKQGVDQAMAKGSFKRGVQQAGDSVWQANTLNKGPQRFSDGVAMSEAAYADGFAPYAAVIENTSLPPRGPRGDPKNLERAKTMAMALAKRRQGGK